MAGSRNPGPMCQLERPVSVEDGTMCVAPTPVPGSTGSGVQLPFTVDIAQLQCNQVKAELEETLKIRAGFADEELLHEAIQKDWDGQKYNDEVAQKVFPGTAKKGSETRPNEAYYVPMYTDPYSCKIVQNRDRSAYLKEGIPEVIYLSDLVHEQVHQKDCGPDSARFAADMSFPAKRRANELKAYDAKINFLQDWLSKNCPRRKAAK